MPAHAARTLLVLSELRRWWHRRDGRPAGPASRRRGHGSDAEHRYHAAKPTGNLANDACVDDSASAGGTYHLAGGGAPDGAGEQSRPARATAQSDDLQDIPERGRSAI